MSAPARRALLLMAAGLALAVGAQASDYYFDTAQVVSAEPVYAVTGEPHCAQALVLGNLRRHRPMLTLGEALSGQGVAATHCKSPRRQVVAYRVTFRYRGETWTREMPEAPGETVRVRVEVRDAGSGTRLTNARR